MKIKIIVIILILLLGYLYFDNDYSVPDQSFTTTLKLNSSFSNKINLETLDQYLVKDIDHSGDFLYSIKHRGYKGFIVVRKIIDDYKAFVIFYIERSPHYTNSHDLVLTSLNKKYLSNVYQSEYLKVKEIDVDTIIFDLDSINTNNIFENIYFRPEINFNFFQNSLIP